jgi:hypothetical protein
MMLSVTRCPQALKMEGRFPFPFSQGLGSFDVSVLVLLGILEYDASRHAEPVKIQEIHRVTPFAESLKYRYR